MKGNPKVIEYLNKALTQRAHRRQSILAALSPDGRLGIYQAAKKEREESIEEMQHADKLVIRIIFLKGFPEPSAPRPLDDRPEHQGGPGMRPQG